MQSATIETLHQALAKLDVPKKAAREASTAAFPMRLDDKRTVFDEDIRIIELGLDCAQLAKASAPQLVPVQSALENFKHLEMPMPVADTLQPVIALYDANLGLLSGPSPKLGGWCQTMREAIAKVKQDAPPLWATARAEMVTARAAADAKLAEIRARERTLRGWLADVEAKKPVAAGSDELSAPLAAYQDACHFK